MAQLVHLLLSGEDEEACWLLRLLFQQATDISVVGYAKHGSELSALALELSPDVVLIDLDAPGQSTLVSIKLLKTQKTAIRFVGLVGALPDKALRAEMDGVLDKNDPIETLSSFIHQVARMPSTTASPHASEELLSLYLESLEKNQQDLEQRLEQLRPSIHRLAELQGETPVGGTSEGLLSLYLESLEKTQRELDERMERFSASRHDVLALQRPTVETTSEDLLSLYLGSLETDKRELQEQVSLMQFWLQSSPSAIAATPEPVVERLPTDRQGRLGYSLSVDGFFNAHHRVKVAGAEGMLHSHSWRVSVRFRQLASAAGDMLIGFAEAKRILRGEVTWFEGKVLNDLSQFAKIQPTTENVAAVLYRNLSITIKDMPVRLDAVTVWESPTNAVTYSLEPQ